MATSDFATMGPAGANYNRRTADAEYALGTQSVGTNATVWTYGKASEAVATGTCTLDASTFLLTGAGGNHTADTAFTTAEPYGWVRTTAQLNL